MAWPFSTVAAPNLDSGFVQLPNSATNIPTSTAAACWIIGASFTNGSAAQAVTVTVIDGAGKKLIDALALGPGQTVSLNWEFLPATGILQWSASIAATVTGKLWGYI